MNEWLIIIGMLIVTFLPRYLPLALADYIQLPLWMIRALYYIPIAALTVIVVQNSFFINDQLHLSLWNERIITVIVAIVIALITKKVSWVVILGLSLYFALRFFSVS